MPIETTYRDCIDCPGATCAACKGSGRVPSSTVVYGSASIDFFRFLVLRSALQLELKGIRVSRGTLASKVLKRELGFKGSKAALLAKVNELVETYHANRGLQEVQ